MRPIKLVLLVVLGTLLPSIVDAGIAGLTKFFRSQFPGSWSDVTIASKDPKEDTAAPKPLKVDNLCVDMNQMLHSGLKLAASGNMKTFVSKIFADLDNLLKVVEPTRALVLAFDGPAPFAKMQTQRNRRISSPENSIITPGTNLMNSVEDIMVCYVVQRLRRTHFQNLTVFISGPCVPGEGEVKIVEWVNNHMKGDDSLVISGSDSDILLQGLAIANRPGKGKRSKTLILQSTAGGKKDSGLQRQSSFCDVDRLAIDLQKYTGIAPSDAQSSILRNQAANINPPIENGQDVDDGSGSGNSRKENSDSGSSSINGGGGNAKKGAKDGASDRGASAATTGPAAMSLPSSFNLDLIVLFVLQGNDYLPKMRGVTLSRVAGAYGRAMLRLPANQRSLLDLEHNTFNFLALWTIMDELGPWTAPAKNSGKGKDGGEEGMWKKSDLDKAIMPLPVTLPTSLQSFHTFLQRKKTQGSDKGKRRNRGKGGGQGDGSDNEGKWGGVTPEWSDFSNDAVYNRNKELQVPTGDVVHAGGTGPLPFIVNGLHSLEKAPKKGAYKLWGTSVEVDGRVFAADPIYSNKKLARQVVSAIALQQLDADMYSEMTLQRELARSRLLQMRRSVMLEESQYFEENFPGILLEGALQQEEEQDERGLADGQEVKLLVDDGDGSEGEGEGESGEEAQAAVEGADGTLPPQKEQEQEQEQEESEEDSLYVSEEEYTRFVTDEDVEAYLQGILWVVQMYVEGVCPDLGYTFVNRPPASPACVQKYVEKRYLQARAEDLRSRGKQFDPFIRLQAKRGGRKRWGKGRQRLANSTMTSKGDNATAGVATDSPSSPSEGQGQGQGQGQWTQRVSGIGELLDQVDPADLLHPGQGLLPGSRAHSLLRASLHTPQSPAKPLSASGACVCVVPMSGQPHVPLHLLSTWGTMQVKYFDRLGDGRLMDASYEEVLTEMGAIFDTAKVIADVTRGAAEAGSDDEGGGLAREADSADRDADSAASGVPVPVLVSNHTVSVGDESSYWTVIAPGSERSMRSKGFRAAFHPHFKKLSAFSSAVPFSMPKKIPYGHRLLVTDQQLVARGTKFKKYGASDPGVKSRKGGGKSRRKQPGGGGKGTGGAGAGGARGRKNKARNTSNSDSQSENPAPAAGHPSMYPPSDRGKERSPGQEPDLGQGQGQGWSIFKKP